MTDSDILLDVRDLHTHFATDAGAARAADGVSFTVRGGETCALVGESGSGKSVTALSLTRLLPSPPASHPRGRVLFRGADLLRADARALRGVRGAGIAYVFQEPATSLNPSMRVGAQIAEALRVHRAAAANGPIAGQVAALLRAVGIPDPAVSARAYPHAFSGGMQQRAMLAMALACRPSLLVADEPTTALDVTIQAQILELLDRARRETGMAILLITHNLGLVAEMADRVYVMYAGQIVESGPAPGVLREPRHPYTRALLAAVPRIGRAAPLRGIPGAVPQPAALPAGCRFHPRCPQARPACARAAPEPEPAGEGREVRCPFWK